MEILRLYRRIKEEVVYRGPSTVASGVSGGLTTALMDKLPLYESLPAAAAGGLLAGIVVYEARQYLQNRRTSR